MNIILEDVRFEDLDELLFRSEGDETIANDEIRLEERDVVKSED